MAPNNDLTGRIIGCCFKVHAALGPGFTEKIYHKALQIALEDNGLKYQNEKSFSVNFGGQKAGNFLLDLVVEGEIIVELKAVTGFIPEVFKHQIISYLKAADLKIGLLVNFGNKSCQIKRFSL
ncbi:MAG TPA: GxxExxY protein [Elusimicrobia bacterium]|nr:GxxExxY protein [Elusimicrobiota bacterium]